MNEETHSGPWTQSIKPSENVLRALEVSDVWLLDDEGYPFAILVAVERYSVPHE